MKSLFLQRGDQMIPMGSHQSLKQIMSVIAAYRENNHIPNYYTRFINEQKDGEWITCVDFGLWSEFFYIRPALNLAEEFAKEDY